MLVLPEEYIGLNYKEVESDIKNLGYTNIKIEKFSTNDLNNKNKTVKEFTINGTSYERGTKFNKNDEVRIVYWDIIQSTEESQKVEMLLPSSNSKLGKDFDTKGQSTIYYINVDNIKNIPKLKTWKGITVTDGVAEYLDILEKKGYKIDIVNSNHKVPYAGFDLYEANFKVTKSNISWTMFLSIQDEKYIEYELDINLE